MGTALLKIKLMPTSPDVDLEEIKEKAKKVIEEGKGMKVTFDEEPIAFGLKAVIANFSIDESNELEPIENSLREIENVNSAEVIDMRRAFG
jgi:elongation factor 1-beta